MSQDSKASTGGLDRSEGQDRNDSGLPARPGQQAGQSGAERTGDVRESSDAPDGGASDVSGRSHAGDWANRGVVPRADARTIWVVVADEGLARFLRWPETGNELEEIDALSDSAAHAREGDLHRDAAGRRAGAAPQGSSQGTPQHRLRGTSSVTASAGEDQQHQEAQGFARRVAQHLAEALQRKRFDELRLVAAPRFLGLLRKELSPQVGALVTQEVNKDLIHEDNRAISQRLFADQAGA
ncbi:host attachment protein [Piscinibacter koreensis]|uniref:Host attachment protein n=1 Tax=Piscinibacter koreensis TaxID=2742824 RepID=A0A7Y6NMI9_9BURK|nr:host attachment protein [Schlegelella koreensis]NUZ05819.1 host attachment protein [Schlegelella koreensis]